MSSFIHSTASQGAHSVQPEGRGGLLSRSNYVFTAGLVWFLRERIVLFILISLRVESTQDSAGILPLCILSHTERQEQSKANYTMLSLASRIKISARACARALAQKDRGEMLFFLLSMLDRLLHPHPPRAKLSLEGHTHLKKKNNSLTWPPCQSRPSAREFNKSRIRVSLRNPLYSSRDILAFSLTYINISLEDPPPHPSLLSFLSFLQHCGPICSSDRRVFGVWSRSPDPCLLLGLNSLRWK